MNNYCKHCEVDSVREHDGHCKICGVRRHRGTYVEYPVPDVKLTRFQKFKLKLGLGI